MNRWKLRLGLTPPREALANALLFSLLLHLWSGMGLTVWLDRPFVPNGQEKGYMVQARLVEREKTSSGSPTPFSSPMPALPVLRKETKEKMAKNEKEPSSTVKEADRNLLAPAVEPTITPEAHSISTPGAEVNTGTLVEEAKLIREPDFSSLEALLPQGRLRVTFRLYIDWLGNVVGVEVMEDVEGKAESGDTAPSLMPPAFEDKARAILHNLRFTPARDRYGAAGATLDMTLDTLPPPKTEPDSGRAK